VAARDLGAVVPPGDVDALAAALQTLASDAVRRKQCAAASAQAATDFKWDVVAAPLVEFCRSPRRAPDLVLPAADRALLAIDVLSPPARLLATLREGGPSLLARRVAARLRSPFSR